jgi:hypothetical protein
MDPPERSGWKSARPVLMATLIPLAAALAFFAVATYGHKSGDVRDQPSMAAFDACLTEHGLQSAGAYPTQFDETVAAQQQMQACGDKIPKQVLQQAQDRRSAATSSYRECIGNLAGSRSRGFGRFRGGPSQSYREAFAICRSLLQSGGEGGQQTTPKTPATPVAPVA